MIPRQIFQTWHNKNELPPQVKSNIEKMKELNPEFDHYLFDDDDCLQFIQQHFTQDVVNAFQSLVPGAYKADLWRYCVLYITTK